MPGDAEGLRERFAQGLRRQPELDPRSFDRPAQRSFRHVGFSRAGHQTTVDRSTRRRNGNHAFLNGRLAMRLTTRLVAKPYVVRQTRWVLIWVTDKGLSRHGRED